jgi:hypothetical protein
LQPTARGAIMSVPRLKPDVDMTSVVNYTDLSEGTLTYQQLFPVEDTRVSAKTGPVTPTVDPAEIRGLSTT